MQGIGGVPAADCVTGSSVLFCGFFHAPRCNIVAESVFCETVVDFACACVTQSVSAAESASAADAGHAELCRTQLELNVALPAAVHSVGCSRRPRSVITLFVVTV